MINEGLKIIMINGPFGVGKTETAEALTEKSKQWALAQIYRCLEAFKAPDYEVKINNDDLSTSDVVRVINERITTK